MGPRLCTVRSPSKKSEKSEKLFEPHMERIRCCWCGQMARFRCRCHCFEYCSQKCWSEHFNEGTASHKLHRETCIVPWFVPEDVKSQLPEGPCCMMWMPNRQVFEPLLPPQSDPLLYPHESEKQMEQEVEAKGASQHLEPLEATSTAFTGVHTGTRRFGYASTLSSRAHRRASSKTSISKQ